MKFVLVTIRREMQPGRPRMQYPAVYNAQEVEVNKKGPLTYDGGLGRGEDIEEVLICLRDATADKYTIAEPTLIRTIPNREADTWLSTCKKLEGMPEERVTDADRLLAITAKTGAGIALSVEDLNALNPDNSTRGINRKRKNIEDMYNVVS